MIQLLPAVIYLSFISLGLPDALLPGYLLALLALMFIMHEGLVRRTAG